MKTLKSILLIILSLGLLTYYSCDKDDEINSTWLEVVVVDTNTTTVDSVLVKLFSNGTDWSNSRNALHKGYTDQNGKIIFKDIDAMSYWIEAVKGNTNNWFGVTQTDGAITINKKTTIEIVIKD